MRIMTVLKIRQEPIELFTSFSSFFHYLEKSMEDRPTKQGQNGDGVLTKRSRGRNDGCKRILKAFFMRLSFQIAYKEPLSMHPASRR